MINRIVSKVILPCLLLGVAFAGAVEAAPKPRKTTTPVAVAPQQTFNRNAMGGASGISPGMRTRSYAIADGLKRPGGAQAMGLKSRPYRNDGSRGSIVLPKIKSGKPVEYTSTNMRPRGHKRKWSNGRVITGSDGSIYVTRHYGQDGGKTKRIQ